MARWIVEDNDEFYCFNCRSNITSVIRLTFDENCRKKETLL